MQKGWAARNVGTDRAERALAEWVGHARFKQYPLEFREPATWVVMGGRGAGKTRLGAEWVNGLVRGLPPFTLDKRRYERIALVGDTLGDVREVMIEGPSGILTISRQPRPRFEANRRRLVWDNGAVALMFSSEDPESLRGPQFDAAWCNELAKWKNAEACFDMLQLGLRLGEPPRTRAAFLSDLTRKFGAVGAVHPHPLSLPTRGGGRQRLIPIKCPRAACLNPCTRCPLPTAYRPTTQDNTPCHSNGLGPAMRGMAALCPNARAAGRPASWRCMRRARRAGHGATTPRWRAKGS
jgi:hypothetical protein